MKRLFLFAAYDPDNVVSMTAFHYVKALSALGDVVFRADNALTADQLSELAPYVLNAEGENHGEYDFGSYKRGMEWALANLDMGDYDFVYLVNDSVAGPFRPLGPILDKLEKDADVTGMCWCPKRKGTHIQSWFVGVSVKVFRSEAFSSFMRSVRRESDMQEIYRKYENGLTGLLLGMDCRIATLMSVPGKGIYNKVRKLFRAGLPFIKKSSFTRHNGSLGRQIDYVLTHAPECIGEGNAAELSLALQTDLDRLHGKNYLTSLTHVSIPCAALRYLKYLAGKCTEL